ncbi:hypothetical protein BDV12DRAFT_200508 [Aspergillus spectabilis]
MFPEGIIYELNVPLPSENDQTVYQMIELWFNQHPLSLIISKTAFLHDLRSNRHDPRLLAIILADVTPTLRPTGWASAATLRLFAREQVRKRPADATPLPTIQLLVLLGWHQLCTGEARRGICHINLAHQLIEQWQQIQEHQRGAQRMNGVDYTSVTLELGQRIFWLTSALNLWVALQLEDPFENLTLHDLDQSLPSPDITVSSIYQLDQTSGNVASLSVQGMFWRAFWSLSHICRTVSPVYALLPGSPYSKVSGPGCTVSAQDILRDKLNESIPLGSHPSEIITHVAYQILNIHLLFTQPQPINASLLQDTIQTLTTFIDSLRAVEHSLTPPDILIGASPCSTAGVVLVGIDASCCALQAMIHSFDCAFNTKPLILLRQSDLVVLAQQLYFVCKHPLLQGYGAVRELKVQMKMVNVRLEGPGDPVDIFPGLGDIPAGPYFCEGAVVEPAMLDLEPFEFLASEMGATYVVGK